MIPFIPKNLNLPSYFPKKIQQIIFLSYYERINKRNRKVLAYFHSAVFLQYNSAKIIFLKLVIK